MIPDEREELMKLGDDPRFPPDEEAEPTVMISSIEYETLRKTAQEMQQTINDASKENEHLMGVAQQLRKERDDLRITLATIWSLR